MSDKKERIPNVIHVKLSAMELGDFLIIEFEGKKLYSYKCVLNEWEAVAKKTLVNWYLYWDK